MGLWWSPKAEENYIRSVSGTGSISTLSVPEGQEPRRGPLGFAPAPEREEQQWGECRWTARDLA